MKETGKNNCKVIKHHAFEMYVGVEVQLHIFLTSAASVPGHFNPDERTPVFTG
jgi:hypothetical protein